MVAGLRGGGAVAWPRVSGGAVLGMPGGMANVVYVAPVAGERWVVSTDEDATPPISEHATRGEAETAARSHAMTFGIPEVVVRGQGGHEETQLLEPDEQPPAGASGPSYGPPV